MIYADNAATTKMSEAAVQTMISVARDCYGNPSSLYSLGQRARETLEESRKIIAGVIGAEPNEILFTSGGSEADNQAILSAAATGRKNGKMHIVSSAFEHHAVLHTLERLKKEGFEVTLLPVHEDGRVRPEEVRGALREDTCLVTIMYANNEIGTVQPVREIADICREKGILFHTDAVQAVGHLPVNAGEDHFDMLSASAHKFHGPKGVGFLYAKKGVRLTNLIDGGAQERGKRAGTTNVPGIIGLAKATELAAATLAERTTYETALRDELIAAIERDIPYAKLNGDREKRLPNNVNFSFRFIEGESLLILLDQSGICASRGSACTSGSLDPSHVLTAMRVPFTAIHGSVRFSLSRYTTEEEIDRILEVFPGIVANLRAMSPYWDKEKNEPAGFRNWTEKK